MDVLREGKPTKKRRSARLALLLMLVAGGLVALATTFAFVRGASAAGGAPSVDAKTTWTERVRRGDLLRQVPAQGTLVPEHVEWLSAQTAARVAKIAVRAGVHVEANTVVVVLENTDLELATLEAERQAASAEARLIDLDVKGSADERAQAATMTTLSVELRDADRHAANANRLGNEGLLSANERRDAMEKVAGLTERTKVEEARREGIVSGHARQVVAQHAEIARLKEIAAFRKKQLAALEVRAGIAGVVQDIPLERGQWVAIGTVLAKVAEPSNLKAEMKIAEASARDLRKGQVVRFEGSTTGHGEITRVDPAVVHGSVKVEVALGKDVALDKARADMTVNGYIEIEKLDNVLFVARPAGARDAAEASIFRLDSADRTFASRVSVKLGRGSAREVEIVDGLREGDEIVVSDVTTWDASRVRLK